MKTFLLTYQHDGAEWTLELKADDLKDARARVARLAFARVDGEVMAKIPATVGPLARLLVWLRNFFTFTPQIR